MCVSHLSTNRQTHHRNLLRLSSEGRASFRWPWVFPLPFVLPFLLGKMHGPHLSLSIHPAPLKALDIVVGRRLLFHTPDTWHCFLGICTQPSNRDTREMNGCLLVAWIIPSANVLWVKMCVSYPSPSTHADSSSGYSHCGN